MVSTASARERSNNCVLRHEPLNTFFRILLVERLVRTVIWIIKWTRQSTKVQWFCLHVEINHFKDVYFFSKMIINQSVSLVRLWFYHFCEHVSMVMFRKGVCLLITWQTYSCHFWCRIKWCQFHFFTLHFNFFHLVTLYVYSATMPVVTSEISLATKKCIRIKKIVTHRCQLA